MGKYDDAMYDFLSDNGRFADLFNGVVFHGEEVLRADALEEGAGRYVQAGEPKGKAPRTKNRYRDIKKRLKEGTGFSVVAIENQSDVDYAMPWRIMLYDVLEYGRQIREIQSDKKRALDREKKKASPLGTGFGKGDRLHPVYTICLYHGTKHWDGSKSLGDMMNFGASERLREELFHDYRMSLVCVEDLKDTTLFRTDLRLLLAALGARGDKEAMKALYEGEDFADISLEAARTIAIMTDNTLILRKLDEQKEEVKEKEGFNMCKAWDEILQEWTEEGMKKGIEKGISIFILDNIEEGKSEETIVEKLCRRFSLDASSAQAYYDTYVANV